MSKILISACLLGQKVRYDGGGMFLESPIVRAWQDAGVLVPICPEVAGGLSIPRPPAEIVGGGGADVLAAVATVNTAQADVTKAFIKGAQAALDRAQEHGCKVAVLKAKSPSCGSQRIYDGSHTGVLIDGVGVTTALLQANGIAVFNENELDQAARVFAARR